LWAALHDGTAGFALGLVIFCSLIKYLKNLFEDIHGTSRFPITGNGRCAHTLRAQRMLRLRIDRVMMMCVIVRMIMMMIVLGIGHR
tara:strand:+ start:105 stop:362 length:258 start_codon:yes stop_codon:yes gene_type:complete